MLLAAVPACLATAEQLLVSLRDEARKAQRCLGLSVGGAGTPDNCYRFLLELLRVQVQMYSCLACLMISIFLRVPLGNIITVGSKHFPVCSPGWMVNAKTNGDESPVAVQETAPLARCESTSYMSVAIFTFVQISVVGNNNLFS